MGAVLSTFTRPQKQDAGEITQNMKIQNKCAEGIAEDAVKHNNPWEGQLFSRPLGNAAAFRAIGDGEDPATGEQNPA